MTRPVLAKLKLWLASSLIASVFVLPICDLHFDCGCTWRGSSECDIHIAGEPDCPWCKTPLTAAASLLFALVIGWFVTSFAAARFSRWKTVAVASLAMIASMLVAGALISLSLGLPVFAGL